MRSVNMILKTVAAIVFPILLLSQPVLAQVYQWTDEEGKTHFTDNLNAIPEQFLTKKHKRKMEKHGAPSGGSITEITEPEENSAGETQAEKTGTTDGADEEEKEEEPTGPSPEEVAAANQAIGFLRASIQRYEKFANFVPSSIASKQMYFAFQGNLAAKKAMAEKLAAFELLVLQETGSFLKQSLAQDEVYRKKGAGGLTTLTRQHFRRLISEKSQKEQLIQKLQQVQAVEPATPVPTP